MKVLSIEECDVVAAAGTNYATLAVVAGVIAGSAALVAGGAVVVGAVAVAGVAGLVGGSSSFAAGIWAAEAYF